MARKKEEAAIREDDVRDETLASINVPAHWAYLLGVLAGGAALMIGLIAWLGSAS